MLRVFRLAMIAALAVLAGGFLAFAAHVDRQRHEVPRRSDGIVVLTGGTERIADGAKLMIEGYGRRMLISGVHTRTTADDLARLHADLRDFSTCCVDLGYQALNTRGNAAEAGRWARRHDLKSLIVVTSDYHMPRTIAEFRAAMPYVRLAAHPVVTDARAATAWWQDAGTARLMMLEYLKYLAATARIAAGIGRAVDMAPAPGNAPPLQQRVTPAPLPFNPAIALRTDRESASPPAGTAHAR